MAEKPIVSCQFNTERHELNDECQRVAYGTSGGVVVTDERLSRILFAAREAVEMLADIIEARAGWTDVSIRNLVAEIDQYRAERGWSPHGFGDESS